MPLVGVAITTGARHTAHTLTLVIDAVIIGGLCIYVTYKGRQRDPYPYSTWQKWGPSIICWISLPFILADPLRHVFNDNGMWDSCSRSCYEKWPSRCNWSSNEYKCAVTCGETFHPQYNATTCEYNPVTKYYPRVECTCVHDSQESMTHLSAMGILFTIFFTYFGFALFLVANLWNANIIDKFRDIKHKYRVLRGLSESEEY
eukprot:29384_1